VRSGRESGITQNLIAVVVSFRLTGPLVSRIAEKLPGGAGASAIIAQVTACARRSAPVVADRVMADPWWGVQTVASTWLGSAPPEAVLVAAVPECGPAVATARPFLSADHV
jgi:hypothetical protein